MGLLYHRPRTGDSHPCGLGLVQRHFPVSWLDDAQQSSKRNIVLAPHLRGDFHGIRYQRRPPHNWNHSANLAFDGNWGEPRDREGVSERLPP